MRKSRFTEEQIAYALRHVEQGTPAAELCRKMGVSEQTFYTRARPARRTRRRVLVAFRSCRGSRGEETERALYAPYTTFPARAKKWEAIG